MILRELVGDLVLLEGLDVHLGILRGLDDGLSRTGLEIFSLSTI